VPQELWAAIAEKPDEYQQRALALDDETDDVQEVFDPGDYDDFDDEF
jgi:hypothetical protein